MVSPTELSPPTLKMSNIPSSYAVKLELYTKTGDVSDITDLLEKGEFRFEKHLNVNYGFLKEDVECFFECEDHKIRNVAPNRDCDQSPPYLIFLRERPEDRVFWMYNNKKGGVLSDGQFICFGTPNTSLLNRYIFIHNYWGCDSGGKPASRDCGQIFRTLLHQTPDLENDGNGEMCGSLGLRCHLCIPLPLLWLLAAVQTRAEIWRDILPGIIQDGTLRSHDVAASRDKLRVIALYAPGLDYEQKVVVPPLPHGINWNGSGHSSS